MTPNKDTPAFPTITWEQLNNGQFVQVTEYAGLSKREQIAAMVFQGMLSNATYFQGYSQNEDYARHAVQMADALLLELSKPS